MITPYLVYKELMPCGRLAWRRMVNPQYSQITAIDVAFQQRSNLNLKPVNLPSQVIHHEPVMVLRKNLVLPNLVVNPSLEKGH